MAGRKSDFTLPKFDDIFSTQEMRDDEKLAKIRDIPLELIDDFPDHPYRVQDDEDMDRLVESILTAILRAMQRLAVQSTVYLRAKYCSTPTQPMKTATF